MTVASMWTLQQAVYTAVAAAVPTLTVLDHVAVDPPRLHVRIDGFTMTAANPKNCETVDHRFLVHVFDSPADGDRTAYGQKTVKQTLSTIHAALHRVSLGVTGAWRPEHEDTFIDTDEDGSTIHGVARYVVTINGD